jgi:glycogen operon protein
LRNAHPVLRQRLFFTGTTLHGNGTKDLAWFGADGGEMTPSDWYDLRTRTSGMYLSGKDIRQVGPRGEGILDESYRILLHAGLESTTFKLPGPPWGASYDVALDSSGELDNAHVEAADEFELPALSLVVLRIAS